MQLTWRWICVAANVFSSRLVLNLEYVSTRDIAVFRNLDQTEFFLVEWIWIVLSLLLWSGSLRWRAVYACASAPSRHYSIETLTPDQAPCLYTLWSPSLLPCWYHAQRMSPPPHSPLRLLNCSSTNRRRWFQQGKKSPYHRLLINKD